MLKRADSAGTTTHPSTAALPNAHAIFRWDIADARTKQVKAAGCHPASALD